MKKSASETVDNETAAEATIRQAGAKIRARRKAIGMTLNELGERTGVSVSMLSMLERGVAGASIGTLVAVSSALRVQMYDLFEVPESPALSPVTRAADQTEVETGAGVLRRVAHHAVDRGLEMAINEYEPGTASGERAVHHDGREYGVVIGGQLTVELGGQSYDLQVGDAISYSSTTPHRISNTGSCKARAVWVNLAD